jgi:hypothetical protein
VVTVEAVWVEIRGGLGALKSTREKWREVDTGLVLDEWTGRNRHKADMMMSEEELKGPLGYLVGKLDLGWGGFSLRFEMGFEL